jgi:surface antigen
MAAFTIAATLAAAGCSYPLDSMYEKSNTDHDTSGTAAAAPSEVDLAYARAVAADVIARGASDSVPWENPHTGVGGNIIPLPAAPGDRPAVCREFLASYKAAQAQSWLQGEACRGELGKWEVKTLKRLKS